MNFCRMVKMPGALGALGAVLIAVGFRRRYGLVHTWCRYPQLGASAPSAPSMHQVKIYNLVQLKTLLVLDLKQTAPTSPVIF